MDAPHLHLPGQTDHRRDAEDRSLRCPIHLAHVNLPTREAQPRREEGKAFWRHNAELPHLARYHLFEQPQHPVENSGHFACMPRSCLFKIVHCQSK
jgi:hypothetical protein